MRNEIAFIIGLCALILGALLLIWRLIAYFGDDKIRAHYEQGVELRKNISFWQMATIVVACGDIFYLLRFWLTDCQQYFLGKSKDYPDNYEECVEQEAETRRKRLSEYRKTWDRRYK